jgi:glycosyltransferase involved in cell wall biosynthesis
VVVAYLINQYPQTSQSFIRREIAALESEGIPVQRITVRSWEGKLVEPADIQEKERTPVILDVGAGGLAMAVARTALTHPLAFLKSLGLAIRVGRKSERGVLMHLVYVAEACVLRKWVAEAGANHLHAHFGTNSATVAMLCRELGGPPYSFTCHGPEEFDSPRQLALGEKVRRSAFAVAISEFGRSQLFRWADAKDWHKIHVVRCTVDASFLKGPAPQAQAEALPDRPMFVSVGRLSEQKGQAVLIEAAGLLRDHGAKFFLNILGDGELRPLLEAMIDRLNLRDHVRLSGWADAATVRREMLRSRALVMASFAEGLPVVIMEALALGRPVIATSVAGIPELVETGICGWLVPPGSAPALAEAMRAALDAPEGKLREMAEHGAERVARWHDQKTEAAKLVKLLAMKLSDDQCGTVALDCVPPKAETFDLRSNTAEGGCATASAPGMAAKESSV